MSAAPAALDLGKPGLSAPERWTATLVLLRLEEAAETLRRLPADDWRPRLVSWPEPVRRAAELAAAAPGPVRLPARADAIDRLDATLAWLAWIAPERARILWARANGASWSAIAATAGQSSRTCRRRAMDGLMAIVRRLERERRRERPVDRFAFCS